MIAFEPLCRIEARVGNLVSLGPAKHGERRYVEILGGTAFGPGLNGEIVPGSGGDWQILRADGVLEIDAHYLLRLSGGALVEVISQGYRHGPAEVIARLAAGQPVASSEYFFRTAIRFETGSAEFAHLNRTMAIASGARGPNSVALDLFKLL